MKKTIFATMFMLALASRTLAQIPDRGYHQGETFELEEILASDEEHTYTASNNIRLLSGFKSKPNSEKSSLLSIGLDPYGIYPPENGLTNPKDCVVGSLGGTIDIGAMGGLSYTIPLDVPIGINGMQPSISISYNNQSGNGLLGWGWDLNATSSITRTGQTLYHDGQMTAANLSKNDRFLLDGQRLILIHGNYGNANSEYRTENDCMAKIMLLADDASKEGTQLLYFKVWEMSGNILEYRTRLCSPDSTKEILWMLSRVSDRYGNTMEYHYNTNNNTGEIVLDNIEYTFNEGHNIEAQFQIKFSYTSSREDYELYYIGGCQLTHRDILTSIKIVKKDTGASLSQYRFNYIRNLFGNDNRLYYILSSIDMMSFNEEGTEEKTNPTLINWDTTPPMSAEMFQVSNSDILEKFPFTGDFNGDGYTDVALVPYKPSGQENYPGSIDIQIYLNDRNHGFTHASFMDIPEEKVLDWIYILDINDDGLDDLVTVLVRRNGNNKSTSAYIYLNRNTNLSFLQIDSIAVPNEAELLVGDFSGNGVQDLLFLEKIKEKTHYKSETTNTDTIPYIINAYYAGYQNSQLLIRKLNNNSLKSALGPVYQAVAVDSNGDGISEVLLVGNNEPNLNNSNTKVVTFLLNNQNQCFTILQELYSLHYNLGTQNPWCHVFPGDYNGDGKTDLLFHNGIWYICFSNGNQYMSNHSLLGELPSIGYFRNIFQPSLKLMNNVGPDRKLLFFVTDIDGDGCSDVCFSKENYSYRLIVASRIETPIGTGIISFRKKKELNLHFNYRSQFSHVGNFLGHDNMSLLESIQPSVDSKTSNAYIISPVSVNKYNSVASITDGMGNTSSFTYAYTMPESEGCEDPFYTYTYAAPNQWDIRPTPLPMLALRTCKVEGINGSSVITKYSYDNAYNHKKGHGFIGFRKTISETYRNSIESGWHTRTINENEYSTMGGYAMMLPQKESFYINDNGTASLVNKKAYNFRNVRYYITENSNRVVCPAMQWKTESTYSMDDGHEMTKSVLTNYHYTYNDLYTYVDSYGCDETSQTVTGYENGHSHIELVTHKSTDLSTISSNWIINRPNSELVTISRNNESTASLTEYTYSSGNVYEPSQVTLCPNNGSQPNDPLTLQTHYSYDAFGNVTDVITSAPFGTHNEQPRAVHYHYGSAYQRRLLTRETKGDINNGFYTQFQYDFHDRLSSATDCNGKTIRYESSPLGVVQKTFPIDGTEQRTLKLWANDSPYAPEDASYYTWSKKTGGVTAMTFYHKTGLELRTVTFGFDGTPVYVDKTYNNQGLLDKESAPYRQGDPEESIQWTSYTYDNYERPLRVCYPDGTVKTLEYHGLRTNTTVTPQSGDEQMSASIVNAMDWPKENIDGLGSQNPTSVHYEYYPNGKLKWTRIGSDEATTIRLEYDHAGNRILLHDPDYCTTTADLTSIYNAFGEEVSTTTPNGLTTTYQYDQFGRMTQRTEEEPTPNGTTTKTTIWDYYQDASEHHMGLLHSITYPGQIITYTYDDYQRIRKEVATFAQNESYTTRYTFDPASRIESRQYPSGFKVMYHYNNIGHFKEITDHKGNSLYRTEKKTPLGQIERFCLSGSMTGERVYHPEKHAVTRIYTTKGENILQDLSYEYDGFSNLATRTDNKRALVERFTYDHLNRLVKIKLNNSTTGWMDYDPYGRMTRKIVDNWLVFSDAVYNETAKPHAIDRAATDEGVFSEHTLTYTCFDKVKTIAEGNNTLEYTYGYDRQRIFMEEHANGTNRTKRYVGGCEFQTATENNTTTTKNYTFIDSPIGVVAVVEKQGNDQSIHYVLKDHLGSWTTITDSQGNVEQELSFDAWGNRRNPETWYGPVSSSAAAPMFDRGFTGHEHPYAFGLINMNGRMYDPKTSSFLSVDAYVQSPDNSQSFNRYAYCLNNPLKYTDPTGWQPVGGLRPGNPFHENWGVNFAEKVFTTQDVKQWLWNQGISVGVWMEGEALTGSGCGSGGGDSDDDKGCYYFGIGNPNSVKVMGPGACVFASMGMICKRLGKWDMDPTYWKTKEKEYFDMKNANGEESDNNHGYYFSNLLDFIQWTGNYEGIDFIIQRIAIEDIPIANINDYQVLVIAELNDPDLININYGEKGHASILNSFCFRNNGKISMTFGDPSPKAIMPSIYRPDNRFGFPPDGISAWGFYQIKIQKP